MLKAREVTQHSGLNHWVGGGAIQHGNKTGSRVGEGSTPRSVLVSILQIFVGYMMNKRQIIFLCNSFIAVFKPIRLNWMEKWHERFSALFLNHKSWHVDFGNPLPLLSLCFLTQNITDCCPILVYDSNNLWFIWRTLTSQFS